jgi:hypothetical protein
MILHLLLNTLYTATIAVSWEILRPRPRVSIASCEVMCPLPGASK